MKISVDDKELFTLTENQKKTICNDINEDIFYEDMCRRLKYILNDKYQNCLSRLKNEWIPILKSRVDNLPQNEDQLLELIFSQPDYKSRKQKEQ